MAKTTAAEEGYTLSDDELLFSQFLHDRIGPITGTGFGRVDVSTIEVSDELKEFFKKYIEGFNPTDIQPKTKLIPFIPEFFPSTFFDQSYLKVPRPDGKPEYAGKIKLDELPKQSDPESIVISSFTLVSIHPHKLILNYVVLEAELRVLHIDIPKVEKSSHLAPLPSIFKPKSQTKGTPAVAEWNVDEVISWIESLNLSQSYNSIIESNYVNGEVLLTMKTKDDWKELGVTKFGDVRILITKLQALSEGSTTASSEEKKKTPTRTAIDYSDLGLDEDD